MSKKITSVLSLLLAMCLLLCACSGEAGSESTGSTDATQTTTPYVSHAVTVGSHELDSTTFNYFYTDAIGYFYEVYYDYFGSYASLYIQMYTGMSPTSPRFAGPVCASKGATCATFSSETFNNGNKTSKDKPPSFNTSSASVHM